MKQVHNQMAFNFPGEAEPADPAQSAVSHLHIVPAEPLATPEETAAEAKTKPPAEPPVANLPPQTETPSLVPSPQAKAPVLPAKTPAPPVEAPRLSKAVDPPVGKLTPPAEAPLPAAPAPVKAMPAPLPQAPMDSREIYAREAARKAGLGIRRFITVKTPAPAAAPQPASRPTPVSRPGISAPKPPANIHQAPSIQETPPAAPLAKNKEAVSIPVAPQAKIPVSQQPIQESPAAPQQPVHRPAPAPEALNPAPTPEAAAAPTTIKMLTLWGEEVEVPILPPQPQREEPKETQAKQAPSGPPSPFTQLLAAFPDDDMQWPPAPAAQSAETAVRQPVQPAAEPAQPVSSIQPVAEPAQPAQPTATPAQPAAVTAAAAATQPMTDPVEIAPAATAPSEAPEAALPVTDPTPSVMSKKRAAADNRRTLKPVPESESPASQEPQEPHEEVGSLEIPSGIPDPEPATIIETKIDPSPEEIESVISTEEPAEAAESAEPEISGIDSESSEITETDPEISGTDSEYLEITEDLPDIFEIGQPEPERKGFFSPSDRTTAEPGQDKPKSKRGRKSLKQVSAEADLIEVPEDEVLFGRQYYTMGEVAEMFRVNQSLLRFWENEFAILQPKKNKKGDRHFRPADIKNLHLIYHLLRQRKYTIEGAKEFLKKNKKAEQRFEAIQRLQQIRSFLLELKAQL